MEGFAVLMDVTLKEISHLVQIGIPDEDVSALRNEINNLFGRDDLRNCIKGDSEALPDGLFPNSTGFA